MIAFTERIAEAGLTSTLASKTMTMADIEGDGDLDLYITNYKLATPYDLYSPEERAFDRVVALASAHGIDAASAALKAAQPELMRGAAKGVMPRNTASRKISRLSAKIKAL